MAKEDVFIKSDDGVLVSVEDMKRYWSSQPDPNFSKEKNERVIANSIKKAEEHRKKMNQLQKEGLGERVNALASYIKYLDHGGMKTAEGYFGRKELAKLQARKVTQILLERKANGQPLWKVINTE